MIKAVIFDLNGVFLESEYLSDRMAQKYGVSGEKFLGVLKEVMAIARRPGVKDAFELWQPRLERLGLSLTKEEFFGFWFSGERLAPKLIDYAQELRAHGLKVFILSNNFKERTEYYRQNFPEIFQNVDGAYFSWETGYVKPDLGAYQNILAENDLKPDECIYFDDSSKNVEVARSLGMHAQEYRGLDAAREYVGSFDMVKD